ncbi:response regulator, partial [Myxococcota bacterium]|nr:response regulator [Myxococcota bacterium]
FDPFFTTKEQGKGTGLGLSTVYGIVKQSGGAITIKSKPDHGTSIDILFPFMSKSDDISTEIRSNLEYMPAKTGETILLVEDQEMVRKLVIAVLSRAGYRVLSCESAARAIDIVDENPDTIDLILTDIVLRGMSGAEMVQVLKKKGIEIKALYMSGFTGGALDKYEIPKDELAFLEKPFSPEVLSRKVREVLDFQK